MKVELKETSELGRELSIEIAPEAVTSAMEEKFSELRRSVELKGFRKGKAPLDIVKSMYADKVRVEVVDNLIKETYPKAVAEKTLRIATRPTVTDLRFEDDGRLTYTAQVEVFPEVPAVDYGDLTVETAETEATDQEVDDAVEHMLRQASELRTVDREVRDSDVVIVDLKKLSDSKGAIPRDSFPDSEVDLAYRLTVQEFKEALPGMKVGEEKQITVRYDDDYSDAAFAGAEICYQAAVKEVKERITPEFNDAFAKSTGVVETALELKMKIRQSITRQNQENLVRVQKHQIVRQLCEKNPITIPEGLISEYLDSITEDRRKKGEEVSDDEIRMRYRDSSINSMRWDILYRRIAELEKIEVLPSDTETWINGFAERNRITPEEATAYLRKGEKLAELKQSLLEEKVLDFLMSRASKLPYKK